LIFNIDYIRNTREVYEGKVRYLGLSNVTSDQVRQAHRIHPIAAVQYEYSLWRRKVEIDLLHTLRELDIALVAWSPLSSGFLTCTVGKLEQNDFRQNNPRFNAENLAANRDRFAPLMDLAREWEVTPTQLALACLLHQGQDIFPIPGTRRTERVD
jgi:aryl-alcohol dehydrogenase-like predicted oxidoreductase